jgi:hypothetical protein
MSTCPECLSELADGAAVCRGCGKRVVGKRCPECAEMCREEATKCAYCGHSFARQQKVAAVEKFSAEAARLPTLILKGRLIPEQIHLNAEKILIQSWGLFGLSRTDEEIPWEKIAGYHYHAGLFWDSVEIQTRGQKANEMTCLRKGDGLRIKTILEQMKE